MYSANKLFTLVKRLENTDNLLSSTKFNQVMSNTHRKGFGVTAFKSNDAPPVKIIYFNIIFEQTIL